MSYLQYTAVALNLVLCHAYAAPERFVTAEGVKCLLVERASILQRGRKPDKFSGMANVGHQITPGPNFVLAVRAFQTDLGPDTDRFTKATLEFAPPEKSLEQGKPWNVKVLRSYYSEGNEGFVPDMHGWSLNPFTSFQLVYSKGVMIEVKLEGTVELTAARGGSKYRQKVAWKCPVKPRYVWQLDAWEGKVTGPDTGNPFKPNHGALIMENFPAPP